MTSLTASIAQGIDLTAGPHAADYAARARQASARHAAARQARIHSAAHGRKTVNPWAQEPGESLAVTLATLCVAALSGLAALGAMAHVFIY